MASTTLQLDVPIFAGQGTAAANSIQTRDQALRDASTSTGSVLLTAFHEAFHAELLSLLPAERQVVDIDLSDFTKQESLIILPAQRYTYNPVISGPTLFVLQALRYLAFAESTAAFTSSLTPFSDILQRNVEQGAGILGFSSGILPACVVGTSLSTIAFVSRSVEAYRLAIWIGIRSQIYRRQVLNVHSIDPALPWSLVFVGLKKEYAEEAIAKFDKVSDADVASLYITAVMDDTCVTISGAPDRLSAFSESISSGIVHKTTLDTLYHSPIHAAGIRQQIIADAALRNIAFPTFADIRAPIRSTFNGSLISRDTDSSNGTLIELVVDMIITQPVNWDLVVQSLSETIPEAAPTRLLNIGPGSGLTRSMERVLRDKQVSSFNISSADVAESNFKPKQEAIAIVGMAVNMPGAPNANKLWEVLEQGINTVSEIPEHRFKVSEYNEGKNAKRAMKAHTGNFIDGVDEFDNKFFKISPREAKSMDPQQRILLHAAYEALEDSGYVPNATPTSKPDTFGCYIGVATHDYLQNLRNDIDVYYSTGTLKAFLSGRLSYAMQLSGPSLVIDTACSSSAVAVYQGARALMNRDCDAAMVGGVNIVSSPDMMLGLDRGHFLSPTGQCKAFDASADGYSRSEGCGIFVLKRLSDAVAENDNILGVIRGMEVNQSGLAHSITHPHAPTQATLFKSLLANTGIPANRVNVVEAHGTGTQAGDPNELESIRSVFAVGRPLNNPLHITSVKANIGHLEAASGAAGLAKLLLMLRNRTIPKQISLKNLNPRIISLESDNTVIDTAHAPWVPSQPNTPRAALLNNFGAAGSNTALLLEEYIGDSPVDAVPQGLAYVFGLSAKDDTALDALRVKYLDWLKDPKNQSARLSDVAYTATARRQIFNSRLAVSASHKQELIEKLTKAPISKPSQEPAKVVFVFSGQGSQYLGMGSALYETSSVFKHHVDECHAILIAEGFPGVIPILTAGGEGSGLSRLEEFEAYQSAIFALEYALSKLWMSWGLVPSAVVGHSLGEYAALVIAEVISLRDALMIVANRVRFMVQKCAVESTGMMAINLDPPSVSQLLTSGNFSSLSISCYNSGSDCVLSGPLDELKIFKAHLDDVVHCKNVVLSVPFGYHSSAMAPLLEDLGNLAKRAVIHAPTIPIISNVTGSVVLPGDASVFDSTYFSRHCAEPVRFDKGIRSLLSQPTFAKGVDVWLEIGPHTATLPMLKTNPDAAKGLLLGSLRKQQNAWITLTTSLAQLYSTSISINWRDVFSHLKSVSCISLPTYPFTKTKFWVDFKEGEPALESKQIIAAPAPSLHLTDYSMLHTWVQHPSKDNGWLAKFDTPISQLTSSIRGHSVGGMPLCPASVYLEQVYAGIELSKEYLGINFSDRHVILRDIQFAKPLVYDEAVRRIVTTSITFSGEDKGTFSVSSRTSSSDEAVHVHGEYQVQDTERTAAKFSRSLPVISRHMAAVLAPKNGKTPETFSTRTAYEVIFPRVVDYAKEYQTMKSLVVDASGMEGHAKVKLPADYDRSKFVVHPVFVDTLLHVAGFVANMQGGADDAYICSEVGSVKVLPDLVDNNASYEVYCNNAWLADKGVMLAEAYAVKTTNPKIIVAHLKGMHFRKVRLGNLKKGLAHAAGKTSITKSVRIVAPPAAVPTKRSSVHSRSPTIVSTPTKATPSVNVRARIVDIVAETCDVSAASIDVDSDLASLGVDSLMSIEIFGKLEAAFPEAVLNSHTLSYCKNVSDIIGEVSSKLGGSSNGDESGTHSTGGSSSPRTLVQDDGPIQSELSVNGDFDVKQVLSTVLDVKVGDISDDADLAALGLDSLTSIEALQALKTELGIDLSNDFFSTCQTVRQINNHLSKQHKSCISASPTSTVVDIKPQVVKKALELAQTSISRLVKALRLDTIPAAVQTSTSKRLPLFLIHDGSGLTNYYDRLSPLDRNIWGINNPHFVTAQPWDNVVEMATAYANYVADTSSGPVILGGWSFGGVAAYEASLQLAKRGIIVKGILLIDSPSPINHVPLSDSLIDSVVNLDARSANSDLGKLVKTQFAMNARMLGRYDPRATGGSCPPLVLLRSSEGYNPPGVADVPIWLANRSDPKIATAGWETLAGGSVQVIDIPGHHFQPFHPSNIADVSLRIAEGCELIERL
ncbi:hypothetical protein BDQ12DRAFT_657776 [Crucibulum laeve]|uniref:Polyketide synthase n=1 Tax=Crucibulum laeve TaxID=68775 RepID=A0A5C3LKE3_9AGAR|nr:hypothetical protein BDQ12DRAFT_657776 [Crucibulum laeve]